MCEFPRFYIEIIRPSKEELVRDLKLIGIQSDQATT